MALLIFPACQNKAPAAPDDEGGTGVFFSATRVNNNLLGGKHALFTPCIFFAFFFLFLLLLFIFLCFTMFLFVYILVMMLLLTIVSVFTFLFFHYYSLFSSFPSFFFPRSCSLSLCLIVSLFPLFSLHLPFLIPLLHLAFFIPSPSFSLFLSIFSLSSPRNNHPSLYILFRLVVCVFLYLCVFVYIHVWSLSVLIYLSVCPPLSFPFPSLSSSLSNAPYLPDLIYRSHSLRFTHTFCPVLTHGHIYFLSLFFFYLFFPVVSLPATHFILSPFRAEESMAV